MVRWRAPAALVAAALVVALGHGSGAGAEAPSEHGYWWRLQSGVGPHLTPPGVPEGGLWVTDDPSGDQAVSALRFQPPAGTHPVALRLDVAEVTGTPTVVACPSASAWEPADAGSWEERPDASCDAVLVTAELSDDGTVLTVPLPAFGDGPLDIVLVPDSTVSGYFSISFQPPGGDAFELSAAAPAPPSTAGDRPAGAPVPTVAPRPAPVTYEPPPANFATPLFQPPPDPTPAFTATTVVAMPAEGMPSEKTRGTREPLAIVALVIVVAGWAYRGRAALRGAPDHPLSAANVAFARSGEDAS